MTSFRLSSFAPAGLDQRSGSAGADAARALELDRAQRRRARTGKTCSSKICALSPSIFGPLCEKRASQATALWVVDTRDATAKKTRASPKLATPKTGGAKTRIHKHRSRPCAQVRITVENDMVEAGLTMHWHGPEHAARRRSIRFDSIQE